VRDAIDYGLLALGGSPDIENAASRTLARGFADRNPIVAGLLDDGPLDPERLIADFKRWFGHEVMALAARVGRPEAELTKVSDRTLRKWRSDRANGQE